MPTITCIWVSDEHKTIVVDELVFVENCLCRLLHVPVNCVPVNIQGMVVGLVHSVVVDEPDDLLPECTANLCHSTVTHLVLATEEYLDHSRLVFLVTDVLQSLYTLLVRA